MKPDSFGRRLIAAIARSTPAFGGVQSGPLSAAIGRNTFAFGGTSTMPGRNDSVRPSAPTALGLVDQVLTSSSTGEVAENGVQDERIVPKMPPSWSRAMPFTLPAPMPAGSVPSFTTQRLSGAMYQDIGIAEAVISELVDDPGRAVPPSFGFDVVPVVNHALRSRRLHMLKNGILTLLLFVSLSFSPLTTLFVFMIASLVRLWHSKVIRAMSARARNVAGGLMVTSVLALSCLAAPIVLLAVNNDGSESSALQDAAPEGGSISSTVPIVALIVLLGSAILVRALFRIVTKAAMTGPLRMFDSNAQDRIWQVGLAQRGNVTFSRSNPFLGSGRQVHAWSVTIPLQGARLDLDSGTGFESATQASGGVDSVEVHRRIRQALESLAVSAVGRASAIPGLTVVPHVAADGIRMLGDPVLAANPRRVPPSLASREALEAIISAPQDGLRYYDRVTVFPRARSVTTRDGWPMFESGDSDGQMTAFVHASIEGSVLYLEFSGHVLTPVRTQLYVREPPKVSLTFLADLAAAPWRLGRTAVRIVSAGWRQADGLSRSPQVWRDVSSRLSVRELVSQDERDARLQVLDGMKYIKVVEQVVIDAVSDFLQRSDVGTSEFLSQVQTARSPATGRPREVNLLNIHIAY